MAIYTKCRSTPKALTIFYSLSEFIKQNRKAPVSHLCCHNADRHKKGMLEDHFDAVVYMLPRDKL